MKDTNRYVQHYLHKVIYITNVYESDNYIIFETNSSKYLVVRRTIDVRRYKDTPQAIKIYFNEPEEAFTYCFTCYKKLKHYTIQQIYKFDADIVCITDDYEEIMEFFL